MNDNEKAKLCALYAEELAGGNIVWEGGEFFASIRNDSDQNTMIIHHWFLCETMEETAKIEDSLKTGRQESSTRMQCSMLWSPRQASLENQCLLCSVLTS